MNDLNQCNTELFSFLRHAPTAYHAEAHAKQILVSHDFIELDEGTRWQVTPGRKYFCSRNGSFIAFWLAPNGSVTDGFRIVGAHTDSPSLKLKHNLQKGKAPYIVAGVEKYGGGILQTWFDRELSVAGLVTFQDENDSVQCRLLDFERPIFSLPNLAIHLNRTINEGVALNPQSDMCPILGLAGEGNTVGLEEILTVQLTEQYPDMKINRILGHDLFCYDPAPPTHFGLHQEFIGAARLDNLLSCAVAVSSFSRTEPNNNCLLFCANHEEIGSRSNTGALSNFLVSVLNRIESDSQQQAIGLHNSLLLSLDNAHATHPNFPDKTDPDHEIVLNRGPVIKMNSSQRYATTARTGSIFRVLAAEAGLVLQEFIMRSNMACGSTIGPLTSAQLGLDTIDIGAPTWGMHSIREVTGSQDPVLLRNLVDHFLSRESLPSCT